MAKIIPIDVIKGICGKYGNNSNDYFATNTSSNKIRLAKLVHPFQGPATEKQVEMQQRFSIRLTVVNSWLNANKPSPENGKNGTKAYQYLQKLKRTFGLSSITQVLYKHMNEENVIQLPQPTEDEEPQEPETHTVTLSVNNAEMGSVSGGGRYEHGAQATLKANAQSGYSFLKWSDESTLNPRTLTVDRNYTLMATFRKDAVSGGDGGSLGD